MVDRVERSGDSHRGSLACVFPSLGGLRVGGDRGRRVGVDEPGPPVGCRRRRQARDAGAECRRQRPLIARRSAARCRPASRTRSSISLTGSPRDAVAALAWTKRSPTRSPSSIGSCSCCSPRRAGWCRSGIRSTGQLHDRIAAAARSSATGGRRALGGAAGHLAPRTSRLPCRHAPRHAVQRPAVRSRGARRSPNRPRSTIVGPRTSCSPSPREPARDRRERIAYARPRRRAARRRVRARARLRSRDRRWRRSCSRDRDGARPPGPFYTPRSMTEYLVRRTLAPLVSGSVRRTRS